jgi:hypothetical protein
MQGFTAAWSAMVAQTISGLLWKSMVRITRDKEGCSLSKIFQVLRGFHSWKSRVTFQQNSSNLYIHLFTHSYAQPLSTSWTTHMWQSLKIQDQKTKSHALQYIQLSQRINPRFLLFYYKNSTCICK